MHRLLSQVFLAFVGLWFIHALPLSQRRGHYFIFWRTTTQELLPHLDYLQKSTHSLVRLYFKSDLVNQTQGSEHSMESARDLYHDLYERLNLATFPSNKVLSRENKTQFVFIKGLLKETYRLTDAYRKILKIELAFRCDMNDTMSKVLCDNTKEIQKGVKKVAQDLKQQLKNFFLAGRLETPVTSKRERQIATYIKKKQQADETYMRKTEHVAVDIYDEFDAINDDYPDLDTSQVMGYRKRNKASVGVLYGIYVHLKDTEGTLRYAVKLLQPTDPDARY